MRENREQKGEGAKVLSSSVSPLARAIQWFVGLFYIPIFKRYIPKVQFIYLCCGVANYIVLDSILYFLIYHYGVAERYIDLGIVTISPHVASLIIVFPITFLTGFMLNRYVVFESTTKKIKFQITRYAITVMGSIILNYLIIKILVEQVEMWATPAKVICSIITSMYSYMMARYFTFVGAKKVAGSSCVQTK